MADHVGGSWTRGKVAAELAAAKKGHRLGKWVLFGWVDGRMVRVSHCFECLENVYLVRRKGRWAIKMPDATCQQIANRKALYLARQFRRDEKAKCEVQRAARRTKRARR